MNVLVTYGSKRGGTAEIVTWVGRALREAGFAVDVLPARAVRDLRRYDAVVAGGALYAGRWHPDARRFVLRHAPALRARSVWFFSSGPLDDSARRAEIPPTPQVRQLMDHVGARGHATFGGRLSPDARGLIAAKMARTRAGDWRDREAVLAWAGAVATQLRGEQAFPRSVASRGHFEPLPSRAAAVTLGLLAGLSAVFGGAALVAAPDGSLLRMPLSLLAHTPFHDFLVPGLILLVVIGLGNLAAVAMQRVRSDYASVATLFAGGALTVWMIVEMVLLRSAHWLQVGFLLVGVALMVEAVREARAMFAEMGAGRSPEPARA